MPKNEKIIYVYDSFTFDEPKLLGRLFVSTIKGGESYSFEYDNAMEHGQDIMRLLKKIEQTEKSSPAEEEAEEETNE